MSHWNYRVCRETVTNPDGSEDPLYSLREVHYDDEGNPVGWTDPATFVGDYPGEVLDALTLASQTYPSGGVFDLETRETVRLTYYGKAALGHSATYSSDQSGRGSRHG